MPLNIMGDIKIKIIVKPTPNLKYFYLSFFKRLTNRITYHTIINTYENKTKTVIFTVIPVF
jgi:hypothetical protein